LIGIALVWYTDPLMSDEGAKVMIQAEGLTKLFGPFRAVSDVSFSVPRGQVAAFLGPNGAGKTTTMRLLTGFLAPTSGRARIAGYDVTTQRIEAARRIGYLPENGPLYPDMTPAGLLRFLGQARGLQPMQVDSRLEYVVKLCSLGSVLHKPISQLSKGYRQRVGMAHVLLHEPDVLIMDEPTSGLDPNQIKEVRKTIRELAKTKTILLSTHILQEVEAMADRVIFISKGRVAYDGEPSKMRSGNETLEEAFYRLTGLSQN
jgi:ABC-2 type transport system ATP-binding protein